MVLAGLAKVQLNGVQTEFIPLTPFATSPIGLFRELSFETMLSWKLTKTNPKTSNRDSTQFLNDCPRPNLPDCMSWRRPRPKKWRFLWTS
jgi:hypothetical protein